MKFKGRIIKLLIVGLLLLLFSVNAHAWEEIDLYLYYGFTGKDVIVAWDDPKISTPADTSDDYNVDTDVFEFLLYNKDRDTTVVLTESIPGNVFTYTFQLPQTGHWTPKVRVVRAYIDAEGVEVIERSDWTISNDPIRASVNGDPRGWWLFGWIEPVGPIE